MGRKRRQFACITAAVVLIAAGITGSATAGPEATMSPNAVDAPHSEAHEVTLVTGDTVVVSGAKLVDIERARGREDMSFRQHVDARGHVHVVPGDVAALVSAGRVDPRLFDVTGLVEAGFSDADSARLPLIVDHRDAEPKAVVAASVVRRLASVSATAVRAERSTRFWERSHDQVRRVWLDGRVRVALDRSVAQIGAPHAWDSGQTGEGSTVAVLDTGIDTGHPDLTDAVIGEKNFTDSASGTADKVGHGTHVASIVTGSGAASDGRNQGVAPDARLLNGKVLDDYGSGYESSIIAGMEWAAETGADVVNLSLGNDHPSAGDRPVDRAVDRLTEQTGTLFVIAAGNYGPDASSIGSPGAAGRALTVGAVDRDDTLADFSSRGPRVTNSAIKPDITGPGVGIVAARADGTDLGEPAGDGYTALSGTSMSTPHVAGAAAIVASQHPEWTADRIKAHLMATSHPHPGRTVYEQGAGRVDVAGATRTTVSPMQGSLDAGVVRWPHTDDKPIDKTLTYRNDGTEAVTLDLAAAMRSPSGQSAPDGMVTVAPEALTIPAGGTAQATVTVDTSVDGPDGVYGGVVTAVGNGVSLRTPVGVDREVESYDLKIEVLGSDGRPAPAPILLFDHERPGERFLYDESGVVTVRLPKSRYFLYGDLLQFGGDGEIIADTTVAEPNLAVDGDRTLTLDSRDAVTVEMTAADRPEARPGKAALRFDLRTAWGETGVILLLDDFDEQLVRPAQTSAPESFTFAAEAELARPDGAGSFAGSPYLYHVRKTTKGTVPKQLRWRVADSELAFVRSIHAARRDGTTGTRNDMVSHSLPFTLREFYTPDEPWHDELEERNVQGDLESLSSELASVYRAGTQIKRWNHGPFGPGFPIWPDRPSSFGGRLGDILWVGVPLFSDSDPDRYGFGPATGTLQLLRDGEPIGQGDGPDRGQFTVPADAARYTVRTEATRDPSARLSTTVRGEWTFRSSHVGGGKPEALPLLAVRMAPPLDRHNSAPAGQRIDFPVYVQRNGTDDTRGVRTPKLEVSYDEGTTWQQVRVKRHGERWKATVDHPANATFASYRASVADTDGNTATHTVLRAYALK